MENTTLTKAVTFTTKENEYGDVFHFSWNGSCTINVYRGQAERGVTDLWPYEVDVMTVYGDEGDVASEAQVVEAIQEWLAEQAGEGE